MTGRADALVVIGASAGGVRSLKTVVGDLPPELPAAVVIVLHLSPNHESLLPSILARVGPLPVSTAETGDAIAAGHVYVAPPDCHVLVEDGRLSVVRGPKEHMVRPAIDPLFRSAASSYGPRTIAVVLSGSRDDGAAGARAVSDAGGRVIVQDPDEADFPSMPMAAIARDNPDHVVIAGRIAPLVTAMLTRPPSEQDADARP
jgi:two-component system chemotaxis response regulator CheB